MRVRETPEYRKWIRALRNDDVEARIVVRLERLELGNPGLHRKLPGGISELKIDVGPGYRVYYCERQGEFVVLTAGDKRSQQRDIETAIRIARTL